MPNTEREDSSLSKERQNSLIPLEDVLHIINSTPGLLSHQKAQLIKAFTSIEGVEDQKDQARTWRGVIEAVADKLGIEIKSRPYFYLDELENSLLDEIGRLQSFDLRTVVQGVIRGLLDVSPNQLSIMELNKVVNELEKEGVSVDTYSSSELWSAVPHNLRQNKT